MPHVGKAYSQFACHGMDMDWGNIFEMTCLL